MLSSNVKGIFRISASNFVGLALMMLTSFLLPYYISVEQYGYWQLFSLYGAYVGFFVLGFNDGIHLNYSSEDYTPQICSKFKTFLLFLLGMTAIETVLAIIAILLFIKDDTYVKLFVLVSMGIIPVALTGMFTYLNQATLRFKEYSKIVLFDKMLFMCFLVSLMICHIKTAEAYITAFVLSWYLSIGYLFYLSREVIMAKPASMTIMKQEIIANFKSGFPLMIALILGGSSIIVGSRFLIQYKFGIEAFSSYSFALHTLVIASQFIAAVAAVLFPLLKRADKDKLQQLYTSFDKVSSLLSFVLLATYFFAVILIKLFYVKYASILDYLYIIYPLFVFQCKANVLIVNAYKVKNKPTQLIFVNGIGIIIHLVFIFTAYLISPSIKAIALATLLSYCLWYYVFQIHFYKSEGWEVRRWTFVDIVLVFAFIALCSLGNSLSTDYYSIVLQGLLYLLIVLSVYFFRKRQIFLMLKEFNNLLKK